jgi:hypothetical protein
MLRRSILVSISVATLLASAWLVVSRIAESGESPASKIDQAMEEEAGKSRATGTIGDFVRYPETAGLPDEANIFACPDGKGTTPVPVDESLIREELWSNGFADGGMGWACAGQGLVLVNNEGGDGHGSHGDGSVLIRGYLRSTPVAIVRDTPPDRLEQITVEGHPALVERPIPGYPYARASLVVIERYPDEDKRGIVVFVELAPSTEAAIKHAEDLIP